jgi:serine/threonine protein kinase
MHSLGLFHFDLKLENILLMKENLPSGKVKTVAKLADFGLHVVRPKSSC